MYISKNQLLPLNSWCVELILIVNYTLVIDQKCWEEKKKNVRLERIWKDKEILKGWVEFLVKLNHLFNTSYLQSWQSWPLGSVLESSHFSLLQQDTDCPPCLPKLLVKEKALFSHMLQQVRNVAQWIEHKAAAIRPVRITNIFHWKRTHNRAMMSLCTKNILKYFWWRIS